MNERPVLPVPPGAVRGKGRSQEVAVKSATRALEIIELFAVHRHPLSVSEIAGALAIPQSSSSVLLQALSGAGFIARDRQTRKYLPSIRSVFLGNWIHDALFPGGSLLATLDGLARDADASVRIALRSGLHVQYVHVSWPGAEPETGALGPGVKVPICRDAVGRVLLAAEDDASARDIMRHANAVGDSHDIVDVEMMMREVRRARTDGFAETPDVFEPGDRALAMALPPQFGMSAAISLGVPVERAAGGRDALLDMLGTVVAHCWPQARDRKFDVAAG